MGNTLRVLMYAAACGALLTAFSQISDFIKYVFSLGAFLLGLRFFRLYDGKWMRISFIAVAVVLFFVFSLVYVGLAVINGWYLNPDYTKVD